MLKLRGRWKKRKRTIEDAFSLVSNCICVVIRYDTVDAVYKAFADGFCADARYSSAGSDSVLNPTFRFALVETKN